jgi:hypothetical protein
MMQERGEAATNPARKAHIQYGRSGYNKKKHREHQGFTRQDETLVFFDLRH